MKKERSFSDLAILSIRYRKFPSEIKSKHYGERVFMMAAIRYMNYLEDQAVKNKK